MALVAEATLLGDFRQCTRGVDEQVTGAIDALPQDAQLLGPVGPLPRDYAIPAPGGQVVFYSLAHGVVVGHAALEGN